MNKHNNIFNYKKIKRSQAPPLSDTRIQSAGKIGFILAVLLLIVLGCGLSTGGLKASGVAVDNDKGFAPEDFFVSPDEAVPGDQARPSAKVRQKRALYDQPANSYSLFLAGEIERKQGRIKEAIALLAKAVLQDPRSVYLKKELSILYLQNRENEKALSLVEEILKQDPDCVDALILSATIKKALDKNADVKPRYEKALANDPTRKSIYQILGKMYMDEGDTENAVRVFEKMTKQFKDDYTGYYYLGLISETQKDFDKAEALFLQTLELAPRLIEPRLELIKLYQSNGQTSRVMNTYEEILEQYPTNIPAALELGLLYNKNFRTDAAGSLLKGLGERSMTDPNVVRTVIRNLILQKRDTDAVTVLEGMLKGAPENSELHYAAGVAYYDLEKTDQALAQFEAVRPEADVYPDAALHMAIIYYKNKELDKGIEVLNGAYNAAPDKVKTQIIPYMSSFYEEKGLFDQAIAVIDRGLAIDPSNVGLLFQLGVIYDKQNKTDGAIEQMKKVLAIDPDHADALNYIGYTYADKGINLDEAQSMIEKALKQKPDNGYIIDSLGWLYFKKGLIEKAVTYIEKAVNIIPDDPTILEHLGDIYLKMDRREKALEAYERSLLKKEKDKAEIEQKIESLKGKGLYPDE